MNIIIFLLLISICIGLIYLVHKYFSKNEFYLLAIIYCILSFLMSFKIVDLFGVSINLGIIFMTGLLAILYYFINRYDKKESSKLIVTVSIVTIIFAIFLIINSFIIPSLNDKSSAIYENLIFNNVVILILFPISTIITLLLSNYSYSDLKDEKSKKLVKELLATVGITFVNTFIFIYFSYAFIIRFDTSILITLDNYLVMTIIMIMYILIINKIFKVKKVK